ncbi:sensor histidine kinase [Streptomyces sp. NPDC050504]|uniref:sensor histidine kinase n=1 Tax=Streptomyces sp. NPDC050504 TaxID=3365618 RepID=UPI003788529F
MSTSDQEPRPAGAARPGGGREPSGGPRLGRLRPDGWVVLAWYVGLLFTFLLRMRLPGENQPSTFTPVQFYRWDGLLTLALATALTLRGARRMDARPLHGLGLLLAAAVLGTLPLAVAHIPMAQFLAAIVAVYFVAAAGPYRTGLAALALALGVLFGHLAVRVLVGWEAGTTLALPLALSAVVAWALGRTAQQSRVSAEQTRAHHAEQAVTAERLRIARELHDMVAHSIGIIALQAGAARRVIDTQPERAREALAEVENAGRETLSGLRRMLGALREADGDAAAQGVADIEPLAAATTAAGVRVAVEWTGARRPVPPETELAVFRVVQESVTNVVRHAAVGECRVTIGYGAESLEVAVVNGGTGSGGRDGARVTATGSGYGYGLAGMRERVTLLHGRFAAGPEPDGGFAVRASFPLPPSPSAAGVDGARPGEVVARAANEE